MNRSAPPIQDIAMFVAVAQNASFTRAAEQMATSKSNVGKAVQRLEARLGTKLFQRTTRAVRLTEDGETYLEAARTALDGLGEAEIALAARREDPVGRVRLDIAVGLGIAVIPTFAALRERWPRVTLDLSLNDRQADPVKEGWDIVVRIGELPASGEMTVRRLCGLRNCLYAARAYLDRRGPIASVQDLRAQDGIIFRANSGQLRPWSVPEGGRLIEISPNASVVVSDGRSMIDSVRAGLGVAQIFDRVAAPFVAAGEMVHVLPELDVDGPPVHALIPLGRRMPPKTRVVLDHLGEVLRSPI
ncbi:LysR family transcriptional regulator [Sphingomonas sp. dw_22]|uniref:LysR family transcriptional regulator n=1 Tax=Sphingomonas sp. dw_22 TaxID=2721175 RepID=UPI001BD40CE8|nr:LysR family transcriptional regulator [Sphingomonas sp. dw_22]